LVLRPSLGPMAPIRGNPSAPSNQPGTNPRVPRDACLVAAEPRPFAEIPAASNQLPQGGRRSRRSLPDFASLLAEILPPPLLAIDWKRQGGGEMPVCQPRIFPARSFPRISLVFAKSLTMLNWPSAFPRPRKFSRAKSHGRGMLRQSSLPRLTRRPHHWGCCVRHHFDAERVPKNR